MTVEHHQLSALLAGTRHDRLTLLEPVPLWRWEEMIEVAAAEGILPSLHEKVRELNMARRLPSEVADCLASVAELNRERNAKILCDFWQGAELLNRAGVEPLALKGLAYLLTGTYSDPASRYVCDVDLLIPEAQFDTAVEILEQTGYRPDAGDFVGTFRHHLPLFREGSAPLELHHSVGLGPCRRLLPASELLDASSVTVWNGIKLRIPSPDHLVTHLILHSQLLHPYSERIWPPLRALYDLALLQRRYASAIDWSAIERRFRARGQYPTLALHLLQLEETFGIAPPLPLKLSLLTKLRWKRRQVLRRMPFLRFVDPVFIVLSALGRRSRVLRAITESPGGWRQVGKRLSQFGFYRQLAADLGLGRH